MTPIAAMLGAAVAGLAVGSGATVPRLRRLGDRLAHAQWRADHDQLTGLPNRHGAHRRYTDGRAAGGDCMMLVDVDGLKAVNDTYGHQAGDDLIVAVAGRLAAACADCGYASRLGGDEFLVILPGHSTAQAVTAAAAITEAIRGCLSLDTEHCGGVRIRPTASAGIAPPAPGSTWSQQLRRADVALYHAKHRRSGPVVWAPGMLQPPPRRSSEECRVEAAIECR